jgi:hypothetical protein
MGNINESPFRGAFFGLIEFVADFREVPLLPHAPINESNLILGELVHVVGCEIRDDCHAPTG